MRRMLKPGPLLSVVLLLLGGCAGEQSASQEPIVNQQLGLRIASVPAPFQVLENQGRTLRLAVDGTPERGVVLFIVGKPRPSGVNLVAAVNSKKPEIESKPKGEFLGTVELKTPLGSAFTARGRYDAESGRLEEIWVLALHPSGDRLLSMVYRYPADEDSDTRVDQMLQLVGEVSGTESGE
jgi:hypothetical protein